MCLPRGRFVPRAADYTISSWVEPLAPAGKGGGKDRAMGEFWKKLMAELSAEAQEPEEEAAPGTAKGQYGVDYVAVSELMQFNKNLLEAYKHELAGLEYYRKFLEEANDERGREMYRRLIEEEEHHLKMIRDEIEEHKKEGFWS